LLLQLLQSTIITMTQDMQLGTDEMSSNCDYRAIVYDVLVQLCLEPSPQWPPPTQFAMELLSTGLADEHPTVQRVCLTGSATIQRLLHPEFQVATFPVIVHAEEKEPMAVPIKTVTEIRVNTPPADNVQSPRHVSSPITPVAVTKINGDTPPADSVQSPRSVTSSTSPWTSFDPSSKAAKENIASSPEKTESSFIPLTRPLDSHIDENVQKTAIDSKPEVTVDVVTVRSSSGESDSENGPVTVDSKNIPSSSVSELSEEVEVLLESETSNDSENTITIEADFKSSPSASKRKDRDNDDVKSPKRSKAQYNLRSRVSNSPQVRVLGPIIEGRRKRAGSVSSSDTKCSSPSSVIDDVLTSFVDS